MLEHLTMQKKHVMAVRRETPKGNLSFLRNNEAHLST